MEMQAIDMEELIALEEQGWQALSSAPGDGQKFYRSMLRDDAIMLFPGGMKLVGKAEVLAAIAPRPWESFEMTDIEAIALSPDSGVVAYKVTAQRADVEPYVALVSSTYALSEGTWKLAIHQQTPV